VLRAYPRCDQKTAIQFLDYLLDGSHSSRVIQTDNGGEFQGSFHWHLLDRGIGHFYIRPATPRLNGKVERSHRIDEEEFYRLLEGIVIDDTGLFNAKLQNGKTSTTSADLMAALVARLLRATKKQGNDSGRQVIDLRRCTASEPALLERYITDAHDLAHTTGAIIVFVSHRYSTVRMAGQIVVLSHGRITEHGTLKGVFSRP